MKDATQGKMRKQTKKRSARIVGKVEYREGEGPMLPIPVGAASVETTAIDATLSWTDGVAQFAAAMPMASFDAYVKSGAIEVDR